MSEKESKRLFIAIPFGFDATFVQKFNRIRTCTCKLDRANWVNPSLFHLTLKFLGETSVDRIPDICKAMQESLRGQAPFDFVLDKVGAFGSRYQPRVLWLGPDETPSEMLSLQRSVDKSLAKVGFPRTFGNFVCHLTLARINYIDSKKYFWEQLEKHEHLFSEAVSVREVILYESVLRKGHAPLYIALEKYSL